MNLVIGDRIKQEKDFLLIEDGNARVLFSTNELNRSFNRNTEEGKENLSNLKKELEVDTIVYLNQIHSSSVIKYENDIDDDFIAKEGDGIVTNKSNIAIGVFSADCVPVIAIDKEKKIIGAVHSGWKGTYNSIIANLINDMLIGYESKLEDIKIYIGPHIKQCCYEVSEELKQKFIEKSKDEIENLFNLRNLSLESYITNDLIKNGINEKNIYAIDLCTKCSEAISLHSHRGSEGGTGRMISIVYTK